MWNVRLYYETGFNAVNIPDSPALLETMSHADFPALDILQGEHLASVNVKATRKQVKNADYMRLTDGTDTFYYIVQSFTMTSTDVATLSLAMDYFTTHGGVGQTVFLDGMIERHHVASADDKYGAYTEEDPMLVPSKELDLDEVALFTDMTSDAFSSTHTIVETTLDIPTIATVKGATTYTAEGGDSVTVPNVKATSQNTLVTVSIDAISETSMTESFVTPQTVYCDAKDPVTLQGIGRARALGIEDGILKSYVIPDAALRENSFKPAQDGTIDVLVGAHKFENTKLNFEYANVKNKRVLYGSLNSFVIVSPASGESVTFKPEDIAFDMTGHQGTAPVVCMNTDPRPGGRPYFRFVWYKKDDQDFFLNALKGMEWANAPLRYEAMSGSWQYHLRHQAAEGIMQRNNDLAKTANTANAVLGFLGAGSQATNFIAMEKQQMFEQAIDTNYNLGSMGFNIGMNFVSAGVQAGLAQRQTEMAFKNGMLQEAIGFVTGKIVAPEINFAMSETLRDFRGNGCIVYRYRPQTSDIAKLDKVLTMYGYKDTMPLAGNENVLTNRAKFNYIKATGVSVAGNKPKWLRDGVATQLSVGTRIWHVKPNSAVYTDGSNV